MIRSGWWTVWQDPEFTLENGQEALTGVPRTLNSYFLNSFIITIPGSIACLAAYGFAWVNFRLAPDRRGVRTPDRAHRGDTHPPAHAVRFARRARRDVLADLDRHSIFFAPPVGDYLLHNFMSESLPKAQSFEEPPG